MNGSVTIFPTPGDLAMKFAEEIVTVISESARLHGSVSIALSGGSTPELLYSVIADRFSHSADWKTVRFFWGDERCVPPGDIESNYGMARRCLLDKIKIPGSNIHRIRGENDPLFEVIRYSGEVRTNTRSGDGFPVFDLVILGLGEDGHTASIFPSDISSLDSDNICEVAFHPVTMQKRITLTGRVINNADRITFLVTGKKKAGIIGKIINKRSSGQNIPAARIVPVHGVLKWLMDEEAAVFLRR